MATSTDVLSFLSAATGEVFETMVFTTIEPIKADAAYRWPPSNVVASVALTGHRRGIVVFHSSFATARWIAGSMLDIPPGQIEAEMPDAIGEVANMIAGTFRNKLAEVEPKSDIALPTVTVGSDFSTFVSHVHRDFCHFRFEGEAIYVELILRD